MMLALEQWFLFHLVQQQAIVFHYTLDCFMANSTPNVPHALLVLNVKHVPMVSISCVPDTPPWAEPIKNAKITLLMLVQSQCIHSRNTYIWIRCLHPHVYLLIESGWRTTFIIMIMIETILHFPCFPQLVSTKLVITQCLVSTYYVLFPYSWKVGNGFYTRVVPKLQIMSG
jgi:hypothetical protein